MYSVNKVLDILKSTLKLLILNLIVAYFLFCFAQIVYMKYDCYAQLNGNLLCYVNKTMEYYWWGFMIDCTDVKIIYLSLHYIIFMQD